MHLRIRFINLNRNTGYNDINVQYCPRASDIFYHADVIKGAYIHHIFSFVVERLEVYIQRTRMLVSLASGLYIDARHVPLVVWSINEQNIKIIIVYDGTDFLNRVSIKKGQLCIKIGEKHKHEIMNRYVTALFT